MQNMFTLVVHECYTRLLQDVFCVQTEKQTEMSALTAGPGAPDGPWGPGAPASPFCPDSPCSPFVPG